MCLVIASSQAVSYPQSSIALKKHYLGKEQKPYLWSRQYICPISKIGRSYPYFIHIVFIFVSYSVPIQICQTQKTERNPNLYQSNGFMKVLQTGQNYLEKTPEKVKTQIKHQDPIRDNISFCWKTFYCHSYL